MKGNVGWRLVMSLASDVSNVHPSRWASATYRQSYTPCRVWEEMLTALPSSGRYA
jgi:hypothetical protein